MQKFLMQKGLLLLSGGIDSPVAGHLAKQSGIELHAIHFSAEKIVGNEPLRKSIEACKILGIKKILVADIADELVEITKHSDLRYYFLLSKRLMMKASEKASRQRAIDFLITGENLG
jgi:thiamine biosynthesis protein ThiI